MSDEAAVKTAQRWDVPAIDGSDGKGYLTAGRLQELQKDAYDEAWQKGHADGLAAGEQAVLQRAARFDELLRALSRPFDELDESVEKQLLELTTALLKQLFRREIKINPSHVIGVVREAIQALPIASRSVRVHLHRRARAQQLVDILVTRHRENDNARGDGDGGLSVLWRALHA